MWEFLEAWTAVTAAWTKVQKFFNLPEVHAVYIILSILYIILSIAFGVYLFRRQIRQATEQAQLTAAQARLAEIREQDIVFNQARYVQDLWQKTNSTVLQDPEHLKVIQAHWSYQSPEEVRETYLIFNQLNPLYTAYITREHVNKGAQHFYKCE